MTTLALILFVTVGMTSTVAASSKITVQQQQSQGNLHADAPVTTFTNQYEEFELYKAPEAKFSFYAAAKFCQSGAPNRFLAAVRNPDQFKAVHDVISKQQNAVVTVAGNDVAIKGSWRWTASGRWDGWLFSHGSRPEGHFGVEWNSNQPNEAHGHDYAAFTSDDGFSSFETDSILSQNDELFYLCARYQCNAFDDCNDHGTATGDYYPNCGCKCIDGWFGDKCEIYRDPSTKTLYSLQYSTLPLSYTDASGRCAAMTTGDVAPGSWSVAVLRYTDLILTVAEHELRTGAWVAPGTAQAYPNPGSGIENTIFPQGTTVFVGSANNVWTSEIHYYYCSMTSTTATNTSVLTGSHGAPPQRRAD